MKTALTAIAATLILAGCETTITKPQEHVYDQAATIGAATSTPKPAQGASVAVEKKQAKAESAAPGFLKNVVRTQQNPDQFDEASTIAETQTKTSLKTTGAPMSLAAIIEQSWRFRNHLDKDDKATNLAELEDLSPQALADKHRQHLSYLSQLDNIDFAGLSRQEQINWQILRRQIQELADQYRFKQHYTPITSEYGFHVAIADLASEFSFNKIEDFNNYLAKLAQVERYFSQQIYWMKQGLRQGYSQPQAVLAGFEQTIATYISDSAEQSTFYRPFNHIKLDIGPDEKTELKARAKQLIEQQVIPQYRKFYDFMTQDYMVNARATFGAAAMPNGAEFYNNRVKYYTTLDLNAEQVHQLGLSEVARIRAEMVKIINDLDFKGNFSDFLNFLRTDPQFYATTPQQLLEKAAWLAKKADAILPQLFKTMPRTPYGVEAVPAQIAPKYTTGRYKGASNDNEPGYYWVNTYALNKRPLYVLPSLTLHEAVPGHHLQISLNRELKELPEFRRKSYISAFGEGWGLYSEFLGVETNYYATPYEQFGRLTYEMWRACRLVVDTGIHAKGWSRQQVLDYMAQNTALSLHNIKTETDRYISWPGQALSYKIGELTIKRLRTKAQQALGDKFDIKEFHQRILAQGAVPLPILEQQIDQYIKDQT